MKTFYFNPDKSCDALADCHGNYCAIGQFLRQEAHCESRWLSQNNQDDKPYELFRILSGFSHSEIIELHELNDSDLPMKDKIKEMREMFKLNDIKMIVRKK